MLLLPILITTTPPATCTSNDDTDDTNETIGTTATRNTTEQILENPHLNIRYLNKSQNLDPIHIKFQQVKLVLGENLHILTAHIQCWDFPTAAVSNDTLAFRDEDERLGRRSPSGTAIKAIG